MKNKNSQTLINCKVDTLVKDTAEATLRNMGLNLSSYIDMCLKKVSVDNKLPFTPTNHPEFWASESMVSKAKELCDNKIISKIENWMKVLSDSITETAQKFVIEEKMRDDDIPAFRLINNSANFTFDGWKSKCEELLKSDKPNIVSFGEYFKTNVFDNLLDQIKKDTLLCEYFNFKKNNDNCYVIECLDSCIDIFYRTMEKHQKSLANRFANDLDNSNWDNYLNFYEKIQREYNHVKEFNNNFQDVINRGMYGFSISRKEGENV